MTQSARVPIISTISITISIISVIVIVVATIIILMPAIMIAVPMIVIIIPTVSIVIMMVVVAVIIIIVMVPFSSVKVIMIIVMVMISVVMITTTLTPVPIPPSSFAVVIISVVVILMVVVMVVMISIVDWGASATATATCAHGGGVQLGKVGVGVSAHCQTIEALHVERLACVVADLAHLIKVMQVMLIVHLIMVIVAVTVMTPSSAVIVLLRGDVVGRRILLLVILTLLMPIASIVAELGIVIAAPSLVMAWCIRGYCRVRLITAEEAHVVDNSVPSVLLAEQRQEFKHQLIVGHMALSEHTLDLLEVPLGQAQRFNVLRWPPHMPILAVRPIYAEPTSVIIAFPANSTTRVVALCGNVTFTGHVVSALKGWG